MSKDSINRRPKSVILNEIENDFVVVQKKRERLSVVELNPKVDGTLVRKSQSFGSEKVHKKPYNFHKPTVNVIEENNEMVTEHSGPMGSGRFERNGSVQTIGTLNPRRKTSRSERSVSGSGLVNTGFVGSCPSSIYGGSVNSLPVMREQYCSCTRWSKLEKLLIMIIGVLVLIIVALIISLGVLADNDDRNKHWWAY